LSVFQTPARFISSGALFAATHTTAFTQRSAVTLPTSSALETTSGYYVILKKQQENVSAKHVSVNFLKTKHILYDI
jgi:hypothetical protein